jgi:hypothetical protein
MMRRTSAFFLLASAPTLIGCELIWGLTAPTLMTEAAGGSGGAATGGAGGTTSSSSQSETTTSSCSLEEVSCYSGPPGTENVGNCVAGTRTCEPGGDGYGPCIGEVTPTEEDCDKKGDEDCNTFACSETIWVQQLSNARPAAVAADPLTGEIYVAGVFSGSAKIGADTLTPVGADDVFVTRLKPNGEIAWTLQIGGTKSEGPVGLAYHQNTVTVLIKTAGSLDIGGTVVATGLVAVRYDSDGVLLWAGACSGDVSARLTIDGLTGDALLAGRFSELNCGAQQYFSGGSYDVFVSRLGASDGKEIQTQVWQSAGEQTATAITADKDGNLYFAGDSATDFSLGPKDLGVGMYLAKIAPNGAYVWAQSFGPGGVPGIVADPSGDILLAANCQGDPNDFGGGPLPLVGSGSDVCVAKLSGGEGTQLWARRFGIPSSQSQVGPIAPVSADSAGNFALAGNTNGALTIDGKVISTSGFVVGFNGEEAVRRWLRPLDINVANVAYSKDDALAVAGTFGPGTAELGTGPLMTDAGQVDGFVMLIAP